MNPTREYHILNDATRAAWNDFMHTRYDSVIWKALELAYYELARCRDDAALIALGDPDARIAI